MPPPTPSNMLTQLSPTLGEAWSWWAIIKKQARNLFPKSRSQSLPGTAEPETNLLVGVPSGTGGTASEPPAWAFGPASWRGQGAPTVVHVPNQLPMPRQDHTRLGEVDRVTRGIPFGPGAGRSDRRGRVCG